MSTRELKPGALGSRGEPQIAEHSPISASKKTVPGPIPFGVDPANEAKSVDPINLAVSAVSASVAILRNTTYRLASTVDVNFRLTSGAGTAVATDVYLPAKVPITIWSGNFNTLSAIAGGAGNLQAMEIDF